ncbi:MobA/MobL family protein [Mesorhizobium sp. ESP7-2]|uniref:MobA/MobL family protein n=1 Tax=Mesorhizobium sp. ESP7-2 TaxID=2876622 RepID=UPI001CCB13E3|nr:MobA/MobL family protein [Mesorhizobium sp. ESP7-2]MBZ9705342.1 MobA/MobL family protein [Mesorhizobium sp. ESP7-2]
MTAKVFQRSQGRSAVAAAAYRSASKLTDERIGETFDYTRKDAREAFILAPDGAPAWTSDRGELWNRVEAGERRKDAQVAREVEISIPRDIPESEWRAFAESVCANYVAAGAVVDIGIHCPADVYGQPQPHFHAMITLRTLDESTASGFAKTKNRDIESVFTSGGRAGGERGDALTAERERGAAVMNEFLERAGSTRRASHLSNAERGLVNREPEPTMGAERVAVLKKRGKHDRRTRLVDGMRRTRIRETELTRTEEEIMHTSPTHQARKGIRPRVKADFKATLLTQRFPDLPDAAGWAANLHFVDASNPALVKIATRDGGHVEIAGRRLKVFGQKGHADALAAALEAAGDADEIERLQELKSIQRKGLRQRRKPGEIPSLPVDRIDSLADRWRSRGYTKVTEAPDGVWVAIGACRIQDLGDELRIHGPAASEAAVRAMVEKAAAEWGSEIEVFGDRAFKDAAWTEAQRQGVTVYDQDSGELYKPSEDVRRAFETDRSRTRTEGDELNAIKNHRAVAALVLEAAAGDAAALTRLDANDRQLADFVTLHLDDEQRGRLVGKPEAEVVAALPQFRAFGGAARERENEKRGKAVEGLAPDIRPESDAKSEAWRQARYDARVAAEDEAKWGPS